MRKLSSVIMVLGACCAALSAGFAQNWPISESARQEWQAVGRVSIEGNARSLCTGTLIAPDLVLTAAHCVTNGQTHAPLPFYKLNFVAAWHDGTHAGGSVARNITLHPDYTDFALDPDSRFDRFATDIALVTLKSPLEGVLPIPPSPAAAPPGPVAVLGYSHAEPDMLTDYLGCQATRGDARFLGLNCRPVSGTSGGPVFVRTESGWRLAGVVVANTGQEAGGIAGLAVPADHAQLKTVFGDALP